MTTTENDKIEQIIKHNPAILLLAQLDGGRIVTDLAEAYPLLIEAVKLTGKKGELVLRLKVKPDGKGAVETVEIEGDVTTKVPKRDRRATTFFIDEKTHHLTRNDPKQVEINFGGRPAAATAN